MTAFLPAAHVAFLRSAGPARSYTDRMVIKGHPVGVLPRQGRTGGFRTDTDDLELRASDVPCRLAPAFITVRETTLGGQTQDVAYAVVYSAPTVEIRATDRLEIQPNDEETTPIVIDVTRSELRRTIDLERITRGVVVGGRGTVTP